MLGALFGAPGVIYGQALAGALAGLVAAVWGWVFVQRLGVTLAPVPDPDYPRPYPNPDRYRRR